jgi:hypothetical protein
MLPSGQVNVPCKISGAELISLALKKTNNRAPTKIPSHLTVTFIRRILTLKPLSIRKNECATSFKNCNH